LELRQNLHSQRCGLLATGGHQPGKPGKVREFETSGKVMEFDEDWKVATLFVIFVHFLFVVTSGAH